MARAKSTKEFFPIEIIQDTREKQPWTFDSKFYNANTTVAKLDTGDYTIKGFEELLCIERKKSTTEIFNNVVDDRFMREMERMQHFQFPFMILEFSLKDIMSFPYNTTIPKYLWKKIKVKSGFVLKIFNDIQLDFGVHIIYADNTEYATSMAYNIMKRVHDTYTTR